MSARRSSDVSSALVPAQRPSSRKRVPGHRGLGSVLPEDAGTCSHTAPSPTATGAREQPSARSDVSGPSKGNSHASTTRSVSQSALRPVGFCCDAVEGGRALVVHGCQCHDAPRRGRSKMVERDGVSDQGEHGMERRGMTVFGRQGSPTVTLALPFSRVDVKADDAAPLIADLAALTARLAGALASIDLPDATAAEFAAIRIAAESLASAARDPRQQR